MNLEHHVGAVMDGSETALTVAQVADQVAKRLQDEIRAILNALDKDGQLRSVHGGGSYQTQYIKPQLELTRRF